ncbi:MAG: outer membrane lipoprotein carrier protein LolA [Bdellovibrionota bacterium]
MKKVILFFCALFLQLNIYAFNKNEEKAFTQKLDLALMHLQAHKSFELNFDQELYSLLRDKTSKSQGSIKIKSPNKFRFEIHKPRSELYVSNGTDFWKYTPDLKHAQHLSSNSLELNYISLLTNPASIKTAYKISHWTTENPPPESANCINIILEPKEEKQQKLLYVSLNVNGGFLNELRIVQMNGNKVRLLFQNSKDTTSNNDVFDFKPPQGIVVDRN